MAEATQAHGGKISREPGQGGTHAILMCECGEVFGFAERDANAERCLREHLDQHAASDAASAAATAATDRPIGSARGRLFHFGYSAEQPAEVAELLTSYNAVAQVSELPGGEGFLIRVWPPGGTHEFGGHNLTCLSAVVRFGPDLKPIIEHFEAGIR